MDERTSPPSSSSASGRQAVSARAWCRIDLAGGTLDIWPLGLLSPGARTVNVAIDLAAEVTLRRRRHGYEVRQGGAVVEAAGAEQLVDRPETALPGLVAQALGLPPVTMELECASPRGGGLGGSSAVAAALLGAGEALLGREPAGVRERVRLIRDLEARLMSLPTGVQDQYAAQMGGALEILYLPGGEEVRRLAVDLEALGESLLVVYTGQSHFSAGANWRMVRRRLDGEEEMRELFAGIAEVAAELPAALEAGDLPRAGALVGREWSFRRRLAEGISTPAIEDLLELGRSLCAWGGKACGAGGGGSVALLCPPERRAEIARQLAGAGGRVLDASPTASGLQVQGAE